MPVTRTKTRGNNYSMAVWLINEDVKTLQHLMGTGFALPSHIKNELKQLEWLAARNCVKYICESMGIVFKGIDKDEHGKPLLIGYEELELSITHSYPYVAAIVNLNQRVGIDLEQARPKLLKIAPRFLSENELIATANDIRKICVYWCAKESLFKFYSKGNINFRQQLLIEPFDFADEGVFFAQIIVPEKTFRIKLEYCMNQEYMMCYTLG
jgi:4'-phosphopantetheinyl transferase